MSIVLEKSVKAGAATALTDLVPLPLLPTVAVTVTVAVEARRKKSIKALIFYRMFRSLTKINPFGNKS